MAGLDPAIFFCGGKEDAPVKPGHDEMLGVGSSQGI
jgi:hypothetical protein